MTRKSPRDHAFLAPAPGAVYPDGCALCGCLKGTHSGESLPDSKAVTPAMIGPGNETRKHQERCYREVVGSPPQPSVEATSSAVPEPREEVMRTGRDSEAATDNPVSATPPPSVVGAGAVQTASPASPSAEERAARIVGKLVQPPEWPWLQGEIAYEIRAATDDARREGERIGRASPHVEPNAQALADALMDATDCSYEKCPGAISTQDVESIAAGFLHAAEEAGRGELARLRQELAQWKDCFGKK